MPSRALVKALKRTSIMRLPSIVVADSVGEYYARSYYPRLLPGGVLPRVRYWAGGSYCWGQLRGLSPGVLSYGGQYRGHLWGPLPGGGYRVNCGV